MSNSTLFEYQTGTNNIMPEKTQVGPLFQPWESRTDQVNGFYDASDRDTSRFIPSITQDGVKPFQPVHVGPGLNKGYTSEPSGGFQDFYEAPEETVDDLRTLDNPKLTFAGRILPAKATVTNRGVESQVAKNRPETAWAQTEANWLRTTGAFTGQGDYGKFHDKPTNRMCSTSYTGPAAPATIESQEGRPYVKQDTKKTYFTDGPRNADAGARWTVKGIKCAPSPSCEESDISGYGRDSIANRVNERTFTGGRTQTTNLRSEVDRSTAPLSDELKTTRKEGYVTYTRPGHVKMRGSKEHPVRNQLAPLTTLKETLIHDPRTGNLVSDKRRGATNAYNSEEWRARSTLREKFPDSKWCNAPKPTLTGPERGTIPMVDKARTTTKETSVQDTREGMLHGPSKTIAYDPRDVPLTTTKETTIDQRRMGNIDSNQLQEGMGYVTENMVARPVNRQYISTVEHFNNPATNDSKGYLTNAANAKATLRQITSDNSYTGSAGETNAKAMMDDFQFCNANVNVNKEKISVGRVPTTSNATMSSGADAVNMESKHLLPEDDERDFAPDTTTNLVRDMSACENTRETIKTSDTIPDNRLDPDLLAPFRANPYTQSLSSY